MRRLGAVQRPRDADPGFATRRMKGRACRITRPTQEEPDGTPVPCLELAVIHALTRPGADFTGLQLQIDERWPPFIQP
jgi:hypothetical protein